MQNLRVDESSGTFKIHCDGFIVYLKDHDDWTPIRIYEKGESSFAYNGGPFGMNFIISETTYDFQYSANASNLITLIENTAGRVVFRLQGNFDRTYGGGNVLPNSTLFEVCLFIYSDRIFIKTKWVTSDDIVLSAAVYDWSPIYYWDSINLNVTNEAGILESSGSEIAVDGGGYINYPSADYVGYTSDELNVIQSTLQTSGFAGSLGQYYAEVETRWRIGYNNVTIPAGTHLIDSVIIFDSANREGGKKYDATDRLALGDQYKDTTAPEPDDGAWVTDLIEPPNIGVDGFAADGAWHLEV